MRALLLAAGIGSRLAPLTDAVPKCLAPINGVPLLAYWLDTLSRCGVDEWLINTHHLAPQVTDYVRASPWAGRARLVHEESLPGTGGTLLAHRRWWQDDDLMLIHADNLCQCDFNRFIACHQGRPADVLATMMTFDTPTPQSCGIVVCDPDGRIAAFHEKQPNPPGHRASAAAFLLAPQFASLLDDVAPAMNATEFDFSRDLVPRHLDRFQAWHNDSFHSDIGTPASYLQAQLDYRWPAPASAGQLPPTPQSLAAMRALADLSGDEWTVLEAAPTGFSSARTFRETGQRVLAASIGSTS